jgi:PAS domain S-box-containing protein
MERLTALEKGYAEDERWHMRRDGTRFYMSGVMRPIRDGEHSGFVKVARDMTAQKEAAEALRLSEERYRIALQSAEMGAWDWNALDDRVVWNEQHFTMLGIEPDGEEKTAAFFLSFILPDDLELVQSRLKEAVKETGVFRAEFRIVRRDNTEVRWMHGFGRAITNEDTGTMRLVGVMYDITAQKALERQKDEFIGIASHELRTPVTSIKAYTEVLQEMFEEAGDNQSAQLMEKLDIQVDRLTELIRALLDITKLQEGKLEFRVEPFNLNALIGEETETIRHTTKHRLELHTGPIGEVRGDRERIRQVVVNLVANAVKYSPNADRVVIITEQQGGDAVVCIQDFGIGMSTKVREQVFNRFYRSDEADASTFSGLGLGLYISAEFVKRHGGRIWVHSEKGKGSTFCFSLPATPL